MDKHTYGSDNRRMLIAQTDQDDFSSEIAAATDARSAATGSIINVSGLNWIHGDTVCLDSARATK
jgi:hypothetical protein